MDLIDYARRGYDAPDSESSYLTGSDAYIAWRVGKWLRSTGAQCPTSVTSGPGYRVIVDGSRVIEVWEGEEPQDVTG